ncbi:MAG: B12-binding domain-containing radical SAM protein [Candidatus Aminicenantes bacterium]
MKPGFKSMSERKKFKISLIALYSSSSIGLRYLAAVLRKEGFDVHMIFFKEKNIALDLMELPARREYDLLVGLLKDLDPDLIGIGVRSSFLNIAREITRRIQTSLSKPVIWGGTHATVDPEDSIQAADMICLGEGEQAVLELAQKLWWGQNTTDIQNLWIRKDGQVKRNPLRPLIQNLDSLPFPDYVDENKYFIEDERILERDPGVQAFNLDVLTSRGCPYHCSYCSNSIFRSLYKGKGPLVRLRSVQNVLREINTQKQFFSRLKRIDFIDEVFSWDKEWVEEFVEKFKKDVHLPFHCMQHPITTDRKIMRMLKSAGLERVEIGIQTGSERVRKKIFERPVSDKRLIETSRVMRDLKITPFYDIIVDNPFESPQDKRQGLDLMLKISRPFYMHMFSLIYFPNTILTTKALQARLISEDQVEGRATRSFNQMYVSLKHPRPDEDRYWISLYSLTSKRFVPKGFIKWLSRIYFLQKYPGPLVYFASACNTIKLAAIAVKWLWEGKPVFSWLGRRGRSRKQGSRIV